MSVGMFVSSVEEAKVESKEESDRDARAGPGGGVADPAHYDSVFDYGREGGSEGEGETALGSRGEGVRGEGALKPKPLLRKALGSVMGAQGQESAANVASEIAEKEALLRNMSGELEMLRKEMDVQVESVTERVCVLCEREGARVPSARERKGESDTGRDKDRERGTERERESVCIYACVCL